MNFGVIRLVGTSWEIYKQPVNTFVASFVGNMNFIEGKFTSDKDGFIEVVVAGHTIKIPRSRTHGEKIRLAVRP